MFMKGLERCLKVAFKFKRCLKVASKVERCSKLFVTGAISALALNNPRYYKPRFLININLSSTIMMITTLLFKFNII